MWARAASELPTAVAATALAARAAIAAPTLQPRTPPAPEIIGDWWRGLHGRGTHRLASSCRFDSAVSAFLPHALQRTPPAYGWRSCSISTSVLAAGAGAGLAVASSVGLRWTSSHDSSLSCHQPMLRSAH